MAILWKPDLSKPIPFGFDGLEIVPGVELSSRIAVVDAPAVEGGKAIRWVLRQGDIVQNGNRVELFRSLPQTEFERVTAFSVYFPNGFPTLAKAWQVFAQWHQSYRPDGSTEGRSPPVEFALNGEAMNLNINSPVKPDYPVRTLWSAPLVRDKWLRFILHARWAKDGWVRLFLDGKEVLPKTAAQTTFPPLGNYFKVGLYRAQNIAGEATIYHANLIEADNLADVLPLTPPAPLPATAPVWRAGRTLGRTLYVNDKVIGMVDTAELAAAIVARMNQK